MREAGVCGYSGGVNLPDTITVMELPHSVLFPEVLMPLHIFEQKYRAMLSDCLDGNRMFAVALLRETGKQNRRRATHTIATGGIIRACMGLPDGRSNLVLQGVARLQIVKYIQRRPYPLAQVEWLRTLDQSAAYDRESLLATVLRLSRIRKELGTDLPKEILNSLSSIENTDHLADLVSYLFLENDQQKQQMLETLNVCHRVEALQAFLNRQIDKCTLWKKLQGEIPNKDVGHN